MAGYASRFRQRMGMVRRSPPARGDIWIIELDPTIGHEIQKTRPCLVVSPDSMNSHLATCTIIPMTSGSQDAPFRLEVGFADRQGYLLADQMRTVDRRRLHKKVGALPADRLSAVLALLREMFEED